MQEFVKKLLNNGLDADSAEFLVPPNSFISGQNVRIGGTTDLGGVGYIESILENAEKFHVLPSGGTNTRIGFAADDEQGWIAKFNHNTIGDHGIYLFDIVTETWYNLLLDAQVTDGLNFEKNKLIHSTRIENGCLYWCNSTLNEPRRIDIRAAVNLNHPGTFPDVDPYTSPLAQSVIRWIRRPPGLPLTITKATASGSTIDFIKNEATQYYYRYVYKNYEISVLSGLSLLANYNQNDELYNYVNIVIPLAEKIEQDVLQVDLVVKYVDTGRSFVIKSWNRTIAADLADIVAHNAGSVSLYFDYYNDFIGIALDSAYSVKPYDSLPIYAQTIEIARNRAFMLNYVIGYTTPTAVINLTAAGQQGDSSTTYGQWIIIRWGISGTGDLTYYFIQIPGEGYFDVTPQPTPPPYPDPVDYITDLTHVADTPEEFAGYVQDHFVSWTNGIEYAGNVSQVTNAPSPPSLSGQTAFKSGASYQLSIHFLDHAGRKCGIVTNDGLRVNIPDREYDQVSYTTAINWSLSNFNALAEIPEWAYYYSVNITKCLSTRYFLQSRVRNISYVTKDSNGDYVYNTSAYAAELYGVGVNISLLNSYGMGYVFSEGDLIKIYIDSNPTVYILSIIEQDGEWLVCELQDLGSLGLTSPPKTDVLFQVYSPYKPSASEPFYEQAQIFSITNPTTSSREYSTVAGQIRGDITLLTRNDGSAGYLTENMSPNDKFPYNWNTDAGRPNFIDTIGQQTKTNDIAYSDTLIPGSKTNGLSTFEALNTKDIPLECGDGTKLQVASKIAEQGNIMLALCVNETVSLYLSEAQLLGTSGTAFIAQSADVIGTVNVLQGSYGTSNAESVVLLRGRVFFYSLVRGCFVSYSNNGLFPISSYGMKRVAHLFSQAYASLTASEIEALGSRPFVFGGVDPYHEEVYWSIPATTETPPKGYLPDYVSPDLPVIYPYDIYDGRGKVLVFKVNQDRWAAPHPYQTEGFIDIRDMLFSAKNGSMYKHNNDNGTDDTYNRWYGETVASAIALIINEEPNIMKEYLTLSVEANLIPDFVQLRTELPNIQDTDVQSQSEFTTREGIHYIAIKRDRLSPNVSGTFDRKLYTGDKMRGQWIKIWVQFNTRQLLQIRYINCGFQKSIGGTT